MILVMSAVLSGTALSIREFIKERDIYERERMAGLSATAYLFSKVIVLSVISVHADAAGRRRRRRRA